MKIGLVRRGYSPTGGAEKYLLRFADAVEAAGHSVILFCDKKWPEGVWKKRQTIILDRSGKSPRRFADALEKADPKSHCDILFSLERVWNCDVFRAGDGVHAAWLARRAPFENICKSWFRRFQSKHRELLELEKSLFSPSGKTRVICNSSMVKTEIETHFALNGERITVIPNGFDAPVRTIEERSEMRAKTRDSWGIPEDRKVVLFVGSGWERKGLQFAIDAIEDLPDAAKVSLVVAGKDKRKPRVKRPDRTYFAGPVSNLEPVYEAADAFVLPTIYDPFSNASLEAAAFGLSVITSDGNGLAEHIPPVSGKVVPIGEETVEGLRSAFDRLSDSERSEGNRYIIRERFSTALNQKRTLSFFENGL